MTLFLGNIHFILLESFPPSLDEEFSFGKWRMSYDFNNETVLDLTLTRQTARFYS